MANTVKMVITLDDMASPGLRALTTLIENLGPKVTALSQRFNTLERSLSGLGSAANASTARMTAFDAAAAAAERTAGRLGSTVASTATAMGGLEAIARSLAGVVAGLTTGFNALAAAGTAAAGGLHSAAGGMGAAGAGIGMLQGRVTSLSEAIRGMGEAWLAVKLFQAGAATIHPGSEFQQLEARLKSLNLPANETQEFVAKATATSKSLGFVSVNEAVEARLAALAGLGRNTSELNAPGTSNIIDKTMGAAVTAAMILKQRGDDSSMADMVRNLYGLAEMRGQTSNPDAMLRTFDLVVQNSAATQNKLTMKDLETITRYLKGGIAPLLSDEGFIDVMSVASQFKASGRGGGGAGGGVTGAGTAFTQLEKLWLGGVMSKEAARTWSAMGLMDESKIRNDSDTTQVSIAAGAMKYSAEMITTPFKTLAEKIAPIALAFTQKNKDTYYQGGADINDPHAQDVAIAKLALKLGGTISAQNLLSLAFLPGTASRIAEERKLTLGSDDVEQAKTRLEALFKLNVDTFQKALNNLERTIGLVLLPALTEFLKLAKEFLDWLDDIATKEPTTVVIVLIAGAIASVTLSLVALQRIFGLFTILGGLITALSAPTLGFAAAWAAASGAVATGIAIITRALGLVTPLLAVFLAGWGVGTWLNTLETGGQTIHEWAIGFMGRLVTTFDNGWQRIKNFMGLITDAERDRKISENELRYSGATEASKTSVLGAQIAAQEEKIRDLEAMKGMRYYSEAKIAAAKSRLIDLQDQLPVIPESGSSVPSGDPSSHTPRPPETPEELTRRLRDEASKRVTGVRTLGAKDPNAGRIKYNPEADAAKQEARVIAAERINALRVLDREFANSKLSIQTYFDSKLEIITRGIDDEIAELERERDALLKPPIGRVDQAAVNRVSADIRIKESKRDTDVEVIEEQRTKALNDLKAKGIDVDRHAEAISGRRHAAELMRLSKLMEIERARFEIEGDRGRVQEIDDSRARAVAGEKIDYANIQLRAQLDALKDKEKELTDEVVAGTKTQTEAENGIYNIRKQSAELMRQFIEMQRENAELSGDTKWIKAINDYSQQAKAALTALAPEVLKIKGILETGLTGMFEQFAKGGMSLRKIWDNFFASIMNGLNAIAAKGLAETIGKAVFGGDVGQTMSAISASGGFMGWLGGMMGPSSAPTAASAAEGYGISMGGEGSMWSTLGSWLGNLFSFDVGTTRVPRDMIAKIHKDEMIVDASTAAGVRSGAATLGGTAMPPVNATFVLQQPMDPRSQSQIATEAAMKLHGLIRRNG